MKHTLVINLFAGPGAGKSTGAAYIFSKLKMAGIDVEYVSEFAKDKVWEHNEKVFENQLYLAGKQSFKISRCYGEVDIIVTDSPILQSAIYAESEVLRNAIKEEADKYNNFNVYINRVKEYNPNGRHQTLDEAQLIDISIHSFVAANDHFDYVIDGSIEGYDELVSVIYNVMREHQENQSYLKSDQSLKIRRCVEKLTSDEDEN